jgi:sulfite exporter TauE/SafE
MNALLWSGFILGLAGSLHCAGMCGPIAMALPTRGATGWSLGLKNLSYQGGRIITYGLLGAIFGALGTALAMTGLHQGLSVAMGLLLMASVFFPGLWKGKWAGGRWLGWLKARLGQALGPQRKVPFVVIGMLNGLLPCGLVYVALGAALATGDALTAAGFMLLFGLGTSPMMAGMVWMGTRLGREVKQRFKKLVPVTVFLLGILFFVRGLGLEIPYLSPGSAVMQVNPPAEAHSCH